ncbi:MAG: T9SS type A sorting domain-containing protein [Bacteroidia bacterium]
MKKLLLTIKSLLLFTVASFAQFSASSIWNLNQYVDPMPHNTVSLAGINMQVTYNPSGVPLTGLSTAPMGFPTFRLTSTVNGNSIVCISAEKEGNEPWQDAERATFANDGTHDTAITIEESNDGSTFDLRAKKVLVRGTSPYQLSSSNYMYSANNGWVLQYKEFYYSNNNRVDSIVAYNYSGADSSRRSYKYFYYSNGLDSCLEFGKQTGSSEFVVAYKYVVLQKENGKTKQWALEQRDENGTFRRNGVIGYSNGPASSVNKYELNTTLSVYPNPVNKILELNFNENISIKNITVLNINGQKVMEVNGASSIDVSELSNGLYFIQAISDKGMHTQKFIKQ